MKSPQGCAKLKKKHSNEAYLGLIFYLGVRKGDTSLIWGYTEGYNFDLGVGEYQKVENPYIRGLLLRGFLNRIIYSDLHKTVHKNIKYIDKKKILIINQEFIYFFNFFVVPHLATFIFNFSLM